MVKHRVNRYTLILTSLLSLMISQSSVAGEVDGRGFDLLLHHDRALKHTELVFFENDHAIRYKITDGQIEETKSYGPYQVGTSKIFWRYDSSYLDDPRFNDQISSMWTLDRQTLELTYDWLFDALMTQHVVHFTIAKSPIVKVKSFPSLGKSYRV